MGRLEGKSVVITGAGSGIGRAASLMFTKEGAMLLAVDKTDAVDETVKLVRAAGGTAEAMKADAGSEQDVAGFIGKAVSTWGKLDVIWANAGISGGWVPLHDQTPEQWNEILRINLIGPFLAVKHASLQMMKQGHGGSIICTASVAGLKANAGGNPYSASKAGVVSLVQTSSYSLTGTGIRVNAICPGRTLTKLWTDRARALAAQEGVNEAAVIERFSEEILAGRFAQPQEIADVAAFVLSPRASYVIGQSINVDGGIARGLL